MIVLLNAYGNHSNRLFQNLHFEAFCYENNIQYCNPTFSDMRHLYKNPVQFDYVVSSNLARSKPVKMLRKYGFFKNIISFDEEKDSNLDLIKGKKGLIFVDGWGFRAYHETSKHRNIFKEKYAIKNEYINGNRIFEQIQKTKNSGKIVIGIHVRRGDYARFANGDYYYSDEMYHKIMSKIQEKIGVSQNKEVIFIVFSNEKVNFKNCLVSENEWYVDHYLMMNCDYLIGPPSTFTSWASYLGEVPYLHIKKDIEIDINKFSICKG